MSLSRHLTSSSATHGRLAFHPECPRCRAERLAGALGSERLLTLRRQAALAAGVRAFSTATASVAAVAQEQEGRSDPGAEAPGMEPEFDPGGDDSFDVEVPTPGAEGGDEEDDGSGPPVEIEPPSDPDVEIDTGAPPLPEPAPSPPEAAPAPPASTPVPPPTVETPGPPEAMPFPGTPPVAPPVSAPSSVSEAPAADEPRRPVTSDEKRKPAHDTGRPQADKWPPAGAPTAAAPTRAPLVVEPQSGWAPAPAPRVRVSQPAPESGPATVVPAAASSVAGSSYRVQPGDSLWSIARRLLGPGASAGEVAREVARLWRLNEQRIATGDPDLLHVGTVLRLR
jgi:LysM repeat protein